MKIIYAVIAIIFSVIAWICTQTVWEYQYILEYIAIFIASIFVVLVFIYQEENEISKKYTLFTPYNLIYIVLVIVLLVIFRDYEYEYWRTDSGSFWKMVITVNGIQGILLMIFYKIRDWYNHM